MYLFNYLGFTVGPAQVDKALYGAETITEVFEVQNFSNDSLRIRIEFEDFDIDENGKVTFSPSGTIKNSVALYAVINPEQLFIAPQNKEYVRITFRMPKDAKFTEYYGMLLFKSQPIPTQYQPMISMAGEIGVPIYYSVANPIVKDASFDNLYVLNDSINIVFKNAGNIHLRVKGEAKILKYDETIIEKDSIPEFVVFPKRLRKVKLPLKEQLEQGNYIIRVRLDYGAVQLMEGERRFIK
ncbi:MAG: hypothetical protein ACUVTF_09640 [bacterium]